MVHVVARREVYNVSEPLEMARRGNYGISEFHYVKCTLESASFSSALIPV